MSVKLKRQPLCRYCGKAIAKWTDQHRVGGVLVPKAAFDNPTTIEDCRKMTNETVVSVKYHYETDINYEKTGRRTVYTYNTWDGESYVDEYFCNGDHAKSMGYAAARKGWSTVQWREAFAVHGSMTGRFTSETPNFTEEEKTDA
jgi:hypothetical protein